MRDDPAASLSSTTAVPGTGGVPEPLSHSMRGRGLEADVSLSLALNTTQECFADVPSLPHTDD